MKKYAGLLACFMAAVLLLPAAPLKIPARAAENSEAAEAQTAAAGMAESAHAVEAQTAAAATASDEAEAAADRAESFHYEHDPMENPRAAKDIIVDPGAVYGYSPSPDSTRLKAFVDADWSDKDMVAKAKEERIAYHESLAELYRMIEDMLGQGKNVEEIARAVSRRRNELRLEAYKDDEEDLKKARQSNLETYGDEMGPSADFLYEKYGSWQTVMEKALAANPGMDACLGLYDMYYDEYGIEEQVMELQEEVSEEAAGQESQAEKTSDEAAAEEAAGQESIEKSAAEDAGTYKVLSGDSLWKIAEDTYGDGARWKQIYEANKDKVSDPRLIYPGQELVIPAA